MTPDELDTLHTALGHLARQLWDLQKERIGAGNRVAAMERDQVNPDFLKRSALIVDGLKAIEADIEADIRAAIRRHPLAPWITAQRGIGLVTFANLLGVTGDIGRFPTVSKLWKYLGLHVTPDGAAPKKKKGEGWTHTDCAHEHLTTCPPTCTTDHHPNCAPGALGTAYSPKGRTICYMLGEAIVKVGGEGPYRAAYDAKKRYYLQHRERSGPSGCPMGQIHKTEKGAILACVKSVDGVETSIHVHRAAMRYAVKELVKALWIEWHRVLKPERLEEWERAAKIRLMPKQDVPPIPSARYDYALPVGAR